VENKIRNYVHYQFRFDQRDDIEDLKEELIANLIDRYHEELSSGKTEEEAYITSIKSIGDFSRDVKDDIPQEYSVKPSIPDILLMSGAILSVFGLLLTLFNAIVGTVITALSILIFSSAAYYLYSYSQYVRKEEMDIEKHHLLLMKIFKYMKTSFIFWAISLSLIMASLVMSFISRLILIDPTNLSFDSIGHYIFVYSLFFLIALVIFLVIFRKIYLRLMHRYYVLTGHTSIKGKVRESYEFLYGEASKYKGQPIILSNRFMLILGSIVIGIQMIIPLGWETEKIILSEFRVGHEHDYIFIVALLRFLTNQQWYIVIIPVTVLIANIFLMIRDYKGKLKHKIYLIVGYYTWFLASISIYIMADVHNQLIQKYDSLPNWVQNIVERVDIFIFNTTIVSYSLLMILVLTSLLFYRKMVKLRNSQKGE
jgi:hypothetical protein